MARGSARNTRAIAQVKAARPADMAPDGLDRVTLTLTDDGRVLRSVSMRRADMRRGRWTHTGGRVIRRMPSGTMATIAGLPAGHAQAYAVRMLENIARRQGYLPNGVPQPGVTSYEMATERARTGRLAS
jgi:hypothetical protein